MTPPSALHYNWHIRALSVPGPDTDLSIHVAFDNVRYLFGCGEGTQRAFVQKRLGTRGLSGIFIGGGGSEGRGGLPGVLMTASDSGIKTVDVVGPPDIAHYIATLRASVYRNTLTVRPHPHPDDASYLESVEIIDTPQLKVRSIALRPSPIPSSGPASPPEHIFLHDTIDTKSPNFRPTQLNRRQLAEWCLKLVGDMFQNASGRPHPKSIPMPSPADTDTDMVYICKAPPVPGKFDVGKATALGVPNGPQRANLVRGMPIEVDDTSVEGGRRVIRPEDVIGGGREGAILIIVYCSANNLRYLLETPAFRTYQSDKLGEGGQPEQVHVVVHKVPTAVWQDERYRDWMVAFGPDTQHLMADVDSYRNEIAYSTAAWNTLKLSLLDSEIFQLPFCSTTSYPNLSDLPPNTTALRPYHSVKMHPPGQLQLLANHEKDISYPTDIEGAQTARQEVLRSLPEFAAECAKARQEVRADARWSQSEDDVGSDIMITTLGTGSALPSKHRNVSSTHLDIPGLGGLLLDAGEGTLGQMRRRFGPEGVRKVYRELKMVFISHMHADHHLGLQAVLEDRFKYGIDTKLYLIAPFHIALSMAESGPWQHGVSQSALDNLVWIDNAYLQNSSLSETEATPPSSPAGYLAEDMTMEAIPSPPIEVPLAEDFTNGAKRWPAKDLFGQIAFSNLHGQQATESLIRDMNLRGISTPIMRHRGKAWGLVVEHQSRWKISYSGDTKPCPAFVRAGLNSTLLIHEATLEDDKPEVAAEKGHSTFSQAIDVGRRMNASHILLNHFSQRYPKLPKTRYKQQEAGALEDPVVTEEDEPIVSISFDLMSVKVGDMWRMKHYMDAMEILFPPEEEAEEEAVEKAVEGDVNPTIDTNGSASRGVGKDKRKAKLNEQNGAAVIGQVGVKIGQSRKERENLRSQASSSGGGSHVNGSTPVVEENLSPGKRHVSPSVVEPDSKKVKSAS